MNLLLIYGSSGEKHMKTMRCELNFLVEGLCYNELTILKAYDISILTVKLKSDNVQYINEIYYCCFCFGGRRSIDPESLHIYSKKKLPHHHCWT